jgi:chemotaxis protein methyltransferase CheR
MRHAQCVALLQWALPRMRMRWHGFRKVRTQVCKRIARRVRELELEGFDGYRHYLEEHAEEWSLLDGMCRITISRFYRDRGVFAAVAGELLPRVAMQASEEARDLVRGFSCGCASGEEPYTLSIAWDLEVARRWPDLGLTVVASDIDPHMLERARQGVYQAGSVRELPAIWREQALVPDGDLVRVADRFRGRISWSLEDVRERLPQGPFDLVLCRNLVFTYYDEPLQRELAARLAAILSPGGFLVLGKHEQLPEGCPDLETWNEHLRIWERVR